MDAQINETIIRLMRGDITGLSVDAIVNAANSVIDQNKDQIKKTIWTQNDEGKPVSLIRAASDAEEGIMVCDAIFREKMNHQLPNSDFAILYRTNAQSRVYNPNVRGSVTDAEGFIKALRQRIEARTRYIELLDGSIEYSEFEVIEDQPTNTAATQPDAN